MQIEKYRHSGSMLKEDRKCGKEIKSRPSMAEEAFNKTNWIFYNGMKVQNKEESVIFTRVKTFCNTK